MYNENEDQNKYVPLNYKDRQTYEKETIKLKKIKEFFIFFVKFIFSVILLYVIVSSEKDKLRKNVLNKGLQYMKQCFKGKLLNNNTNILSLNPKISVVIPVYNCEKTIKFAVRSIQNQNMADIEIILVNDNSKDNTSLIIKELAEEDQRIKIIYNEKNMATLYSRNVGILNSKGKYIMNLDNDDLFMDNDVFDTVYEEAEKNNYDMIGFSAIDCDTYNPLIKDMREGMFHSHKDGLTVFQPDLTYFAITVNGEFEQNDLHVWGRLTKTELYKEAIDNFGLNAIGEKRNLSFLTWAEDSAMSMALFRYAKSYKFIKKYGIFHYLAQTTASHTSADSLMKYGYLFFIDTVFDFSHDNIKGKKFSVIMIDDVFEKFEKDKYNEKNLKYLKAILIKMLQCQYISTDDKKKLQKDFES